MNEKYMELAFEQAKIAFSENEIPVGAVIVYNNEVIASAYNTKEKDKCVLKHAEITAITKASSVLNNWRLLDCIMYVTMEPCPMCASAIKQARIGTVYYAMDSGVEKNKKIVNYIFGLTDINPSVEFYKMNYNKIDNLMKKFFVEKRKK